MNLIKRRKKKPGTGIVAKALMAAMGLLMIGMSIAGTIMILDEPLISMDWAYIVMPAYAFSGVVILMALDKSPRFAIFMSGATFGAMNMVQMLVIITQIAPVPSAILGVIMDLAMIISSILCLMGDRYSTFRLLGISLISFSSVFTAQMLDVLGITDHMFGYTTFWWMIVNSGSDTSRWTFNDDANPIASEYTAETHGGKMAVRITSCRWRGDARIRISISPDVKYRLYGSGFVLIGHSIEESGGSRYLRLYGEDGFFFRILIDEGDPHRPSGEEEDELFDAVEYVGDKIVTG